MRTTRREFLEAATGSAAVVSLAGMAPSFLMEAAAAESDSVDETILVIVQLTGGNDGLNTVVPFADEAYHRSRPTLALSGDTVRKINSETGLHPAMRGMADLLEAGQLAIVQGVGYPNPNRSHFESMDIWHTCQRKGSPRATGWLGRFLDASQDLARRDTPTLHLGGGKQPLALAAEQVRTPSIESLDRFRLHDAGNASLRATIARLSEKERESDSLLGFIQSSTHAALQTSDRMEIAKTGTKTSVDYAENRLAEHLRTVAQLIDAGLKTRIYYTELDGFDTHSQQADAHTALLGQFSGAVSAFLQDVAHRGHGDRVLVAAFSEFGRRVEENASEGTDHGAAAPMFLVGSKVQAGLHGEHPSLTDLQDGDLRHHTDFRQVYAALLENWLGWPSRAILGDFTPVNILRG